MTGKGKAGRPIARLRERARQGDAAAQFELGGLYKLGQGVPQNRVLALGWFLRAAQEGDSDARIQVMLLRGELRPDQVAWAEGWADSRK